MASQSAPRINIPSANIISSMRGEIGLEEAHTLWSSRFLPKEGLLNSVISKLGPLEPGLFLGVHFRGTDKFLEADLPSLSSFGEMAINLGLSAGCRGFLITSDDGDVVAALSDFLEGHGPIVGWGPLRNLGGALHKSRNAGRPEAEEAIQLMLALSMGKSLLKTPSALSGWSKVLNPSLDVIGVGRLKPWMVGVFPESFCQWQDLAS